HGMTAGCLTAALALVLFIDDADARRRRDVAIALGLALGWAVVSEFQAVIPAALIGILALSRAAGAPASAARAFLWRLGAGGAVCALVLFTYNALAFGKPLHAGYQGAEQLEAMRRGFFGISRPEWWRLRELLVGSYRGLLPLWPLAALMPIGLVIAAGGRRPRPTPPLAPPLGGFYLVLHASSHHPGGGRGYRPPPPTSGP